MNKMIVSVRVAGLVTAELSLLISEGLTASSSLSLYITMMTNGTECLVTLAILMCFCKWIINIC